MYNNWYRHKNLSIIKQNLGFLKKLFFIWSSDFFTNFLEVIYNDSHKSRVGQKSVIR